MSKERWRGSLCWLVGAAVAVSAVVTALGLRRRQAAQAAAVGPGFVDPVTRVEVALAPLRGRLSSRASVEYASPDTKDQLFEVQYAIAPTLLRWRDAPGSPPVEGRDGAFVLANFPTAAALDGFLERQPHELRWREGGVALLRRR